jgi:peptidoglycan/xylan/chitin deacetylase (PgdA/CDA1 family)
VRTIALKIDADTWRGTREGVPRLARLLQSTNAAATFLFSLGPDHTGRALRRIFRRGFFAKVRRTSVVSNYGLSTLLYGTLLPGPMIGRLARVEMREVMHQGFEVGVHAYDHVKWQDGVARASLDWTRRQMRLAVETFVDVFGCQPSVHGAAGWQVNQHVPMIERELGFRMASDTRGTHAFMPSSGGVLQLPTTLPTLDELIGRDGASARDAVETLLALTAAPSSRSHVFTLHAELEGQAYLSEFDYLLTRWRAQGYRFTSLGSAVEAHELGGLPRCAITPGTVAGRTGELAIQAPE